jgi:hypothetical protein
MSRLATLMLQQRTMTAHASMKRITVIAMENATMTRMATTYVTRKKFQVAQDLEAFNYDPLAT